MAHKGIAVERGTGVNATQRIRMRAVVNDWIMSSFPRHRKYLCHEQPRRDEETGYWAIVLGTKSINGHSVELGRVLLNDANEIVRKAQPARITAKLDAMLSQQLQESKFGVHIQGRHYRFSNGDGLVAVRKMEDEAIGLLLTDPPYGISKAYNCEEQVPRRLRTDGRDFIMPRGNFGEWDAPIEPREWLDVVLPKVGGWFVSFCAQAQIDAYQRCLADHKFVAIGTIVWQKTNPVPFNHRFKPVNAWEAIVVGKRPGTDFNCDSVIHNVFKCKSPSPQKRVHTTQKPLDLVMRFVELFSKPGDVVCDPFAGSGTTIVAAAALGREAVGYEADQENYQAACARIKSDLHATPELFKPCSEAVAI